MFNKPAPSAPSQTTSAPSESASSWRWDLIADAVPALPCGVVTLIAISDDHPFESHTATVGDLMATLFARTERFAYVMVGDQDGPRSSPRRSTRSRMASPSRTSTGTTR